MRSIAASFTVLLAAACASAPALTTAASASAVAATPTHATATQATAIASCTAPAIPLTELTEGPYYKANPPQNATLVTGSVSGTPLVLTGFVLSKSCKPLASARLDFWQADGNGTYDNSGYTLRGWQLTDAKGAYRLETVIPGLYPGRTEHIHVKVTPAGGRTYTTQLFFPGVSQNESDGIYAANMLITLGSSTATPRQGTFAFIVNVP